MRFGPTSLRLTSVLAKGLRRPKLRADLKVSEQVLAGETSFMIKIAETETYARYGPLEYELLQLCDGTRTAADITATMNERHPAPLLSEEEVVEFLDSIDANMWERSLGEKNLAILEKIRDERKKRVDRSNLLYIYFSAWDPDKLLERIHPYLRWLYTREFFLFSLILFGLTAVIVAADYARIFQDTAEFYNFTNKSAYDLWIFWWLLFVISGIHEFGHGLTCKHYGGEVHQMGLMLMYFTPSFYTDCTDMFMFDRTSKRLWTIFAGIWIELVVCALATFVWFVSPPGSFLGDLGYKTLLLTGVSGVFINLNPLMKFDGYFALSQYFEMDNLRDDSFTYLKAWVRRNVLRQDVALPPASRRKRRIFLTFSTAAFLYGVVLLAVVTVFVNNVFTSKFGNWGYVLTAGLLYLILRKRLNRWLNTAVAGLRAAKEKFMAWKMTRLQWAAALIVLGVLVGPPTAIKVTTEFLLEPGQRAEVRAPVPGWVAEVRVREGEAVEAGAVLARLRNPAVEVHAHVVARELELAERSLLAAQASGHLSEIHKYGHERERLQAELAEARRQRAGLVLQAPQDGVVTTPQVEQRVGDYLAEGESFAVLVDRSTLRARVLVRDWELDDVHEDALVKLNPRAYPFRSFSGHVQQIMPAAALDRPVSNPRKLERKGQELTNYFAVTLEFPNPEGVLREGMTGTAKIYGKRYPLAVRAGRSVWRWLRSQLW
ncbi:MAG: efflux RND transporter periplasmic adaptor subunit [Terriglobia bacterium]